MADEKRRLIYELLVEAKGMAQQTAAAQKEINGLGDSMKSIQGLAKKAFLGFSAMAVTKGIADAVSEANKLESSLRVLGITGQDAAAGLQEVQNIAFTTGASMADVAQVYQEAIQAQQQLGGSQADAGKLAEAFTRSVLAQGKGASAAAEQLGVLAFALDKNGVKLKEFSTLLKENETFQTAAQEALGQTTEGLLNMAKAGEIGREELRLITDHFVELAAQQEVPLTFEAVTNSLATMGKAFVTSTFQALGFNDALGATSSGGLKTFLDYVRRTGEVLGGLIRVLANAVQGVIDLGIALVTIATGGPIKETFDELKARIARELEDAQAGLAAIQRGLTQSALILPSTAPLTGQVAGAGTAKTPAQLAAEAREAARLKKIAQEAAEKDAKERKDAEHRLNLFLMGEKVTEETAARMAQAFAEGNAQIEAMAESLLNLAPPAIEFATVMDDVNETIKDNAAILDDAFTNLFTGATDSAKDFFKQILAGFAQVFAQKAAFQATDFLTSLFAKGAAFGNGSVIPFAAGGVVGGPTTFPMSGGRTGLMGESGPEAIMPLRRTKSGSLGVAGAQPSVHLHNNTGVMMDARVSHANERLSIVLEAAQMGAGIAEERINRSMRSGYGATAQSMAGAYGLRRRV